MLPYCNKYNNTHMQKESRSLPGDLNTTALVAAAATVLMLSSVPLSQVRPIPAQVYIIIITPSEFAMLAPPFIT